MSSKEKVDHIEDRSVDPFILLSHKLLALPLTTEAFRVYAQLKKYAGADGRCFPSYSRLAKECFRGSFPQGGESTLKKKAIASVQELIDWGLLTKEHRAYGDTESSATNLYVLTPSHYWRTSPKQESALQHKQANKAKKDKGGSLSELGGSLSELDKGGSLSELGGSLSELGGSLRANPKYIQGNITNEKEPQAKEDAREENYHSKSLHQEQAPVKTAEVKVVQDYSPAPTLLGKSFHENKSSNQSKSSALALKDSADINNATARFEDRFNRGYLSDEEVNKYIEVWNEMKPSVCSPVRKSDAKLRNRIREIARDFSLVEFAGAVVYICKSKDDYFRKQAFTMHRFVENGHVSKCFNQHCHLWENDTDYRARVSGSQETLAEQKMTEEEELNLLLFGSKEGYQG